MTARRARRPGSVGAAALARLAAMAAVLLPTSIAAAPGGDAQAVSPDAGAIEELVVRAGSVAEAHRGVGSIATVREDAIDLTRANHAHELFVRVPGVWISRGSGHEHLTAVRSGVLTGTGACGGFLLLENGVPIRPAGFCNVNNLFEINTEQAAAVEVVRGPASALFGGNALHGVINAVTATRADAWRGGIEAGPYDYIQTRLSGGGAQWRLDGISTSSGGYREDTGYGMHKLHVGHSGRAAAWRTRTTLSAARLNQETGGFVRGFEAYDGERRRSNPNPEAYRDASALRLSSAWRRDLAHDRSLSATPYLRRSSMAFLQHFLPGQPLEKNAQTSGGVVLRLAGAPRDGRYRWTTGAVFEAFAATLSERQDGPTRGSAFLVATRPPGTHYDYRVEGMTLAVFHDAGLRLADAVELIASGRAERNHYDYDNRHVDGNSRDDGTACGFGGCLYTRPADREDTYSNLAGRIGLAWSAAPSLRLYATSGIGYRPPQTNELYRLQRGQTVADLDSERLRSVEVGVRAARGGLGVGVAAYAEATRHLIFRDASGFNVSDGRTEALGVEADVAWDAGRGHRLSLAASLARHRYAFTRDASGGERIVDGNEVDTAPDFLGSARWRWQGGPWVSEFELARVGSHFINASNTARYGGHTLLNWRGGWQASDRVRIFAKLVNATDAAFADRADFAFGSYRYFPGLPRQAHLGVELALSR